ncbi:tRNA (mnm(5)s(2)U34)-methyltransferase [Salicibibacter kimchii]|uniref:Methyltransferase domain-containing protein n=1 Tax=Salicibibacter kimchii TaxID=2099786 RepID=A0A345BYL3_9BACI|nr:class I SAM-dependent methyltransferase [Salicibibacter kimchii]AXF56044.1 methyltransferase domain-containing protein [Salicibibacter kimchii]
MSLYGVIPFAHHLLEKTITRGDTVVDATVGNGHDTVFLANQVGASGYVVGFDIQHDAIQNTWHRLKNDQLDEHVELIEDSHTRIEEIFKRKGYAAPKAAIFNLGYLPGSNKTVTTNSDSTITAITQLLELMPSKGLIVLVIYHGHEEGKKERDALLSFTSSLDQEKALVARYEFSNRKNHPPFLLALEKL